MDTHFVFCFERINYELLVIIIIYLFITFIRRIYNYIPGTNHVLGHKNDTDVL